MDRLFDPEKVSARQFEPVQRAASGAKQYASLTGRTWSEPDPQLQNNHQRGHAQFLALRDAMADVDRPGIGKSYDIMGEHIRAQHDFMTRPGPIGMGIKHEVVHHDPYQSPAEMAADVAEGRIKTYASAESGADTSETGKTVQTLDDDTNDKFRAIHDVFGHAAIGRGFSRHGEEAAYQSHAQMFPPQAQRAMGADLRAQNSYLNYGGNSEFPDIQGRRLGVPGWVGRPTSELPARLTRTPAPKREPFKQERLF